ncbi:hypothetical protein ACPFP2_22440 [Micromonospora citrea]|uniref:hypothetical protein n=1 Tax=Micromonospora citrea TaxID=47855 RepID=UPI003C5A4F31
MNAPAVAGVAALTVVADGDVHIVGSPHSGEYLAVPELGARIIGWLQDGESVQRCAARAEELAGEPVDVADFLATLTAHGLLAEPEAPADAPAGWRLLGRVLFHPVGWACHAALTAVAVVLLVVRPQLRPHYTDLAPTGSALSSLLLGSLITVLCILAHEAGHVAATARIGLRSSLSVSRRLWFVVFQADLTRLWSVPRRRRIGPLLAGMALDAASVGVLLLAQELLADRLGPTAVGVLRLTVVVQISGILIQSWVFARTDVYALFAAATGSRRLWVVKGAVLRRWLRRESTEDRDVLATVTRRELAWARLFVVLYVPGLLYAAGYLVYFGIPGLLRVLGMAVGAIRDSGLGSLAGWSGVAALVFIFLPTAIALTGAARTGLGLLRQVARRRRPGGGVGAVAPDL